MLNFPADDLAFLFTPHLWPSVTFYTVALFTWLVHSGCKGMVAGLEGRNSVFSYQLQSWESPSQSLLELPLRKGAQWGTNPTLNCPQGQKGFGIFKIFWTTLNLQQPFLVPILPPPLL